MDILPRSALAAALIVLGCAPGALADFALRDGDTVVFLGDSITAAGTYGKIIENYTLLRFPGRKVRFHNAGWGGDTAAGGLKRLDRHVFARGATVLTVAYGINDIGWGTKADEEHRRNILNRLTDARSELAASQRFAGHYLPGRADLDSWREQADAINARVEQLQRSVAKPAPYRFVIRPVAEPKRPE